MTIERKQVVKSGLKKVGKAIWSALPWVCLWIWLTCLLLTPVIHANERADLESQISALEAENTRYEAEIDHLDENVAWLHSLIELEVADVQIQP